MKTIKNTTTTNTTMNTINQKALVALFENQVEKLNAHYSADLSVDDVVEHFMLGVDLRDDWTVENAFVDLDCR